MRLMNSSVRRENFSRLITRRFDGSQANIAKALGLSSGRITQLLDNSNPFGERAARSIEEKLALPRGWLDKDASAQPELLMSDVAAPPSLADALEVLGLALARDMADDVRQDAAELLAKLAQRRGAERHQRELVDLLQADISASKRRAR
jgi:hypothetical protein